MAGKVELLTPSNGKVALVGEDTATDVTVTVPAGTDTLLNTSSDIEAQVKTATNASGSAPIYSCRAWCNFNGTGTVAIRASGNVSSITDKGTGLYTVNFTTAMPDANYGVANGCKNDNSRGVTLQVTGTPSTTSVDLNNREYNGISFVSVDVTYGYVAIFR